MSPSNTLFRRERKALASRFRPTPLATALALALALPVSMQVAHAGPGKVCLDGTLATAGQPLACADGNAPIGTYYANSPKLRKFVDTLPGLTAPNANTFASGGAGEYIPLAVADTSAYPGANYYVLAVVEHEQRMHSDLQKPTRLRSYVQIYPQGQTTQPAGSKPLTYPDTSTIFWKDASGADTAEPVYAYDKPHYLGPVILTQTGTPVRIKFVNLLPKGAAGAMFLPVDESLPGAGKVGDSADRYTQNRVAFHLHGGDSPWISDGTPHQWVAAAGDPTPHKRGDRAMNVPDMPDPGDGAMTLFWPNDQSSRLMWYHDHTMGLTRQNAYSGQAAGYVVMDAAEIALIAGGTVNGVAISKAIPNGALDQVVLVLQDKTFVPDDIDTQDSKWDTTHWGTKGDLWFPHVYEPNQIWTRTSVAGDTLPAATNPAGRWDYAVDATGGYQPPNVPLRSDPEYGDAAFPDGSYAGGASATPESFMDTPVVNGVAYPVLNVEPKAYRVRFLNGANDRYWNLSLWVADGTVAATDGRRNTEVKTVPAPDGRPGGVPDPNTAGPNIIQFGNEAGLLPAPVVHKPHAISGFVDAASAFVETRGDNFQLSGAERADTVIDFSQYAGRTLILYNDGAAPAPGGDPRYDYYTGGPDQTAIGGAASTAPGFGPNTRTVMQIRVAANVSAAPDMALPYDPNGTGGALATELPKAYTASAAAHVVASPTLPTFDLTTNQLNLPDGTTATMKVKTIEGYTDPNFGRLIAQIGAELPDAAGQLVATPLAYVDKPSDIINEGETQYWLIKNNDGDNHPMHFHLFNVQVLGRIDTLSGVMVAAQPDEAGWKETVKNFPGEDVLVAVQPKKPQLPFGLPNSVRLLDPTLPAGATGAFSYRPGFGVGVGMAFGQFDPVTGIPLTVTNTAENFYWEYVWHCHILGHEENDLMRPLIFKPTVAAPAAPTQVAANGAGLVTWTDPTPAGAFATKGNASNEIGFRVERALAGTGSFAPLPAAQPMVVSYVNTLANATSYQDNLAPATEYDYRVVAVNAAGETSSAVVSGAPAAPTGLSVQAQTVASTNALTVTLSWTDAASSETGYEVRRGTSLLATLAAGSSGYVDRTALPGTAYTYTVTALRIGTAGTARSSATGVALTTPGVTLVAPTNLAAAYNAGTKAFGLSWGDASFAETGYVVQRASATVAKTGAITWSAYAKKPLATSVLASNLQTFTDGPTGLTASTIYQYQVFAVNGASNGPVASVISSNAAPLAKVAQVQPAGAPTVSTLGIQWQNSASALVTGYEIQRCAGTALVCGAPNASWANDGTVAGVNTIKFVSTGLATKTTYSLRVRAVNSLLPALSSPWSAILAQTTR